LVAVVKLLTAQEMVDTSIGERLEGPKLEPEGPRAEVAFPRSF